MNWTLAPDNPKGRKSKNKLAARFNSINMLFTIFILIITLAVCGAMIFNIADNASRDYARSYTMESVAIISSHLGNEIALVRQAAQSAEIIEWFADEENPQKKDAAYRKMMLYADMLQTNGLHFALTGSGNEYSIDSGAPFADFVSVTRLDPSIDGDRWFFDAVRSVFSFTMGLSIRGDMDAPRLWIDHKVMKDGDVVGVFSSALELDEIFHDLSVLYGGRGVRGLVIDYRGIIQMDSAMPELGLIRGGPSSGSETHILTVNTDADFVAAINDTYLRNPAIYYGRRTQAEVIRLSGGDYRYLSIAPIPNTNWLVITFYDSAALFDVTSIMPPVSAVVFALLVYVIVSSLLIRRFVFKPLNRLTHSVSASDYEEIDIYGIGRDDEIGELARTVENRDRILSRMNRVAALLLDTEIAGFEENLHESMGIMSKVAGVDRVYIWKNHIHRGELCAKQLYEWAQGVAPSNNSEYALSYRDMDPDWEAALSKGKYVNGMVRDMAHGIREVLLADGVLSIFVAPIFVQDYFWGFIGFDDCRRERIFSEAEAATLHSGCMMIGNAFLRHDMTVSLKTAAEEANAASLAKSAFLANMSHEVRTPMNSVIGFTELAMDSGAPPKIREYLDKIKMNAEWLLQIVNAILDLSKIESGKMELENIPFDMHELFTSCHALILPKAVEKGVGLYFYAEPILDKTPLGDPTRLRQVLVNLLSNAVKFTKAGMVKLSAVAKEKSDERITLYFEVKDSGIGMTPEQMEKVLEPFIQAETGTTRKYGGTGLGLAIVKNILETMGGKLSIKSVPGVGSTFSFELTFDTTDAAVDTLNKPFILDESEKPIFEGEVLVCEDNAMNQQVICEHLLRVGLKCVVAENGRVGVDMVQSRVEKGVKQFDLIFMDIHMPVMDGLEASAKILKLNTGIPIVAMTANIMSDDLEIYRLSGMRDYVGKPFTSKELWRCLIKYFKPVSWQPINEAKLTQADNELRQKLINNFVRNNQHKIREMNAAVDAGDVELAHRLVHTLKSNAGQLGELLLEKAAEIVEENLKDGENHVTPGQIAALETELSAALVRLAPLVRESPRPGEPSLDPLDAEAVRELMEKLEPLLEDDDSECLAFTDSLRKIAGTERLILHIEDLEFEQALEALAELKDKVMKG